MLIARGWTVDEVDVELDRRGNMLAPEDDLLEDAFFVQLLARAMSGGYDAVIAGIPCSTFSVARLRPGGPPAVRLRPHEVRGLRVPPPRHEHEARKGNELAWRACAVAEAVHEVGGVYILENPIDRSDETMSRELRLGHWPRHAALWQLEELDELQRAAGGRLVHFPQCALGGLAQKWTTLMYSPALDALGALSELRCEHARDEHRARGSGRSHTGEWATAALAAYPAGMNKVIADAVDDAMPVAVLVTPSHHVVDETATADSITVFALGMLCLYLPKGTDDSTGGCPCTIVGVHRDDIVPYFTVQFADSSLRDTVAERLRGAPAVGSSRPHAALDEALASVSARRPAASMSLRHNEPELRAVLEDEPLPETNVPPSTFWFDVVREAVVPSPLTTDELIPAAVQRALHQHRERVQACYARARRGAHGWRVARDLRPEPLVLQEDEAVLPAGRGWCWVRGSDELWHPLTRSRWPDDPPESELDIDAVLTAARADPARFGVGDRDFPDRFVLACMAHGYPAPELERAAVLGYPHVGALKSMAGLDKCLAKDRKQESVAGAQPWTVHGGDLPQVWPMRADPINVVWRNGKPRITIDKSMELSDVVAAYNTAVDLEQYDPVEMVRVQQLCRAVAILLTAGVGVRIWSFDLESYFRKIGKQREDWWKSGYLLPDGFGFDKRVQFGQKEAPVLTSRQTNFIVWVIRRELHAFDAAHAPRDARLLAWRLLRELLAGEQPESCSPSTAVADPWTSLQFIMQYVDDVGAACVDDLLCDAGSSPYFMRMDERLERLVPCGASDIGAVHARRPDAHYHIAIEVIEKLGHASAVGKGVPPTLAMDLLGVHIDVTGYRRMLTEFKCQTYGAALEAVLAAPLVAGGGLAAPYAEFNSLVHKLLHASSTIVLGRQHLHHCMAARKAVNRLRSKAVLLYEPQIAELRWWLTQLQDPGRHCLPMASRITFPDAADTGVVVSYSDAARELDAPLTSGYGAWTVLHGEFYYVAGLWTPEELRAYSINALELAAENMGTFSFIARAHELGIAVTHSLDFVDNTAAEFSADRGSGRASSMRELVRRRFDALDAIGIYSAVDRITSIDNEWADALSRGEERVADVLRMARALGWTPHRLHPHQAWRDLSGLPRLDA